MHAELHNAIQQQEALKIAIHRVNEQNNELGAQLHFARTIKIFKLYIIYSESTFA